MDKFLCIQNLVHNFCFLSIYYWFPLKFLVVTSNCIKNICIGFDPVHNLSYQTKQRKVCTKSFFFGEGFDNRVCVHVLWYNFSNMSMSTYCTIVSWNQNREFVYIIYYKHINIACPHITHHPSSTYTPSINNSFTHHPSTYHLSVHNCRCH